MFKVPVSAIELDIDNEELNYEFKDIINKIGIKDLYFAGDIRGLMELSNSKYFKLIQGSNERDDIFYCPELSIYFKRQDNLSYVGSRIASYDSNSMREKYHEFFSECKEIVESDREITAERQLLLLKKGKTFTK